LGFSEMREDVDPGVAVFQGGEIVLDGDVEGCWS
jgi:hypothetical protein